MAGSTEVTGTPVGHVVAELDRVRAALAPADGLGAFVDVYRRVTALMEERLTDGTFTDPPFVEQLDVVFAGIFLEVPADLAAGRKVSPAWAPLVERRATRGVHRVQHVLAGMNAHINHDLAVAVVRTCEQTGRDPASLAVRTDFERVNDVLAEVTRPVRHELLGPDVVRHGAPLTPLADLVSSFSIDTARDAAWAAAESLWALRRVPPVASAARAALSRTVGLVGRQLLTVVAPPGGRAVPDGVASPTG